MQAQSKVFACGKAMALGALYDTVERLRWKLLSADSDAGVLAVAEQKTGVPFLIRVCTERDERTIVTIEPAAGTFSSKASPGANAGILLDILTSIIEDALTV